MILVDKVFSLRFVLCFVAFLYYLFTCTICGPINFNIKGLDYFPDKIQYNYLAEAFLKGQLYLPVKVPEELTSLPNPFDPIANKKYREGLKLNDTILYKGKNYLYFGPVPAVVLYIPYRILTNRYMPNNLALLFFTFGSFIWAMLLLLHIKNKYFKKIPELMVLLAITAIGFGNFGLVLARQPIIYHIAIASGCFFMTGAVYFVCTAFNGSKISLPKLFLASLFLGLANGSRPYFFISGACLLFLVMCKILKQSKEKIIIFKSMAVVLLPFLFWLFLLAIYNYVRFGSITNFGISYQIAVHDIAHYVPFKTENFPRNVYHYFFQPFFISTTFPFVYVELTKDYIQPMVGILNGLPITIMIILCPCAYLLLRILRKKKESSVGIFFPKFEFLVILVPLLISFFTLLFYTYIAMRYIAEFATFLILIICTIWFYFDSLFDSIFIRNFLRIVGYTLSLISIILPILFSIALGYPLHIFNYG